MTSATSASARPDEFDPREDVQRLLTRLRTKPEGLTEREAARRLESDGANELTRRRTGGLGTELVGQLVHPLALLLWVAAALSVIIGSAVLAAAIVVVIVVNAIFALVQERHAERAVEALSAYLPQTATVMRDGTRRQVPARDLVRGDVIDVAEGERISADARILTGTVVLDMSMLTGESESVVRTSTRPAVSGPLLEAEDLLFSGTTCTQGNAVAVVLNTGMHTEIGRIAALSQRVRTEPSPLERQVNRVARVIALTGLGLGLAFIPLGTLAAGLSLHDSLTFAIGLLVANVPEGLLPTITLALAVGVRALARQGAIVKRISAVETLGSTSVICTDKTGTLTLNRMQVQRCWAARVGHEVVASAATTGPAERALLWTAAACTDVALQGDRLVGDPTEVALRAIADEVGASTMPTRVAEHAFDPGLRRMSTIDRLPEGTWIHTKGAPEDVLDRCTAVDSPVGPAPLTAERRAAVLALVASWAQTGLRVLAVAQRPVADADAAATAARAEVESGLVLQGLIAMIDPPRPEAPEAVRRCHKAGIRLIVVTGDHGLTAKGIATRVGIGDANTPVITGSELDAMPERELDQLLEGHAELIFARSSPEAKLRIADALRSLGHVIAMTGDGVNDAPALRRADIGVAMGRSGTDVAREASTMILTDDNFATIVAAVESGRRVYDNVRKFIVYIFAHATPEVVPFLLYALAGGRIPLPLTVMQILAIDLGTETLPALALGREPAEPGLMARPPRRRTHGVIDGPMLGRAWGLLGGTSALLVTVLFLLTLSAGGWHWGDTVTSGPLHQVWHQATTMTFLGIVACQVGTAMASRTQTASLRQVGLTTNPLLLWGILFELVFSAGLVALPPMRQVFGTAVPPAWLLALLLPLPLVTWAVDELDRARRRRQSPASGAGDDHATPVPHEAARG